MYQGILTREGGGGGGSRTDIMYERDIFHNTYNPLYLRGEGGEVVLISYIPLYQGILTTIWRGGGGGGGGGGNRTDIMYQGILTIFIMFQIS